MCPSQQFLLKLLAPADVSSHQNLHIPECMRRVKQWISLDQVHTYQGSSRAVLHHKSTMLGIIKVKVVNTPYMVMVINTSGAYTSNMRKSVILKSENVVWLESKKTSRHFPGQGFVRQFIDRDTVPLWK